MNGIGTSTRSVHNGKETLVHVSRLFYYSTLASLCTVGLSSVAEASVGPEQASAGGCVFSVCHAGGRGLYRAGTVPGLHPGDAGLRIQQVPGKYITSFCQVLTQ